jgi:hypothetical protein
VGDVDLIRVWTQGQQKALDTITYYFGSNLSKKYNFTELFASRSGRDLLCSSGPNNWVGYDEPRKLKKPKQKVTDTSGPDSMIDNEESLEDYLPNTVADEVENDEHVKKPHTLNFNGHDVSINLLVANHKRLEARYHADASSPRPHA